METAMQDRIGKVRNMSISPAVLEHQLNKPIQYRK